MSWRRVALRLYVGLAGVAGLIAVVSAVVTWRQVR